MTIDEAKAKLEHIRTFALKNWVEIENVQALDIALWLCDWHAAIKAGVDMIAWEKKHPRPGSKPPMTDDGPGNTL